MSSRPSLVRPFACAIVAGAIWSTAHCFAAPASRPATAPSIAIAKVTATPHFYQRNARCGLKDVGEEYCVPTAISDGLVYFARHGFPHLLPKTPADPELAQGEMVKTLATLMFTDQGEKKGTSPSGALGGLRRYLADHDCTPQRIEYAGWRVLKPELKDCVVGTQPDLDWLRAAVASPHAFAWIEVGHYMKGDKPGEWHRDSGHTIALVGYGTDGVHAAPNPNIFLVDNSGRDAPQAMSVRPVSVPRSAKTIRPLAIPDMIVNFAATGPVKLISPNGHVWQQDQIVEISGPGLGGKKFDAQLLDGAFVIYMQ
jgi:hypothetical protein